jgi:Na+/H+ antiporter NhaC
MMDERSERQYGFKALIPLLVFLLIFVGTGAVFSIMGIPKPFDMMPRYTAVLIGIAVALLFFERDKKFGDKMKVYYGTAGNSGVMMISFIVLMASGFAGSATAIGGMDSIINLGIKFIPVQFLAPGIFLICSIMSLIIGTNLGTATLMAPIAAAMAAGTTLHPGIVAAAVITGVNFGDNISVISDNTIVATSGTGATPQEKFVLNLLIALPAAVLTTLLYAFIGRNTEVVEAVATAGGDYNLWTTIPYLVVLIVAAMGVNVVLVLLIGMGLSCIIGMIIGSASFFDWAQGVSNGMQGVFWLVIFAIMISGLVGLVRYYGGIDWLLEKAKKGLKTKRSTEFLIFFFPLILAAIIANNPLALLITAPIIKDLGDKHMIPPRRMATLMDIGACIGPMVMPHGTIMMVVTGALATTFLDTVKYEYYTFLLAISAIIVILIAKNKVMPKKSE